MTQVEYVYSVTSKEEEHRNRMFQLAREFMPAIIPRGLNPDSTVHLAYQYAEALLERRRDWRPEN